MRKIVNILTLLFLVLTVSCTKEYLQNPGSEPMGEEVELRFGTFDTRATADEEDAVNRVRILIFGSIESQDRGQLLCNKLATPDAEGNIKPVIVTTGVRNIYLIVNEPRNTDGSVLDAYKNIAKEEDIEALELAYAGTLSTSPYRPSDIPMFVKHIDRKVFPNSKNETNSEVERVMAKVTLKLNIKNNNFDAGKQPVIKEITIKNLPNKSYFVARPYTDDLVTSETQIPGTAGTPVTGYDYSSSNTFYIPEYILSSLDKNAYLEIKGSLNGDATNKELTWFVKLGDAMVLDNPTANDRYDITRNRHYTMTGDVKTYGQFEELDVVVTVLPWNMVNGGSELGGFLTLDKTVGEDIAYNTRSFTFNVLTTEAWKAEVISGTATSFTTSGTGTSAITVNLPIYQNDVVDQTIRVRVYTDADIRPQKEQIYTVKQLHFAPSANRIDISYFTVNESIPYDGICNYKDNGKLNTFQKGSSANYPPMNECYKLNQLLLGRAPQNASELIWYLPSLDEAVAISNKIFELSVKDGKNIITKYHLYRGPYNGYVLDKPISAWYRWTSTAATSKAAYAYSANKFEPTYGQTPILDYNNKAQFIRCVRLATQAEVNDANRGIYIP